MRNKIYLMVGIIFANITTPFIIGLYDPMEMLTHIISPDPAQLWAVGVYTAFVIVVVLLVTAMLLFFLWKIVEAIDANT